MGNPRRPFRDWSSQERVAMLGRILFRLCELLLLPGSFVLAVLLRGALYLLKPLVHIRFARFWAFSLGCWAIPLDVYLSQRALLPASSKRPFDLFFHYDRNTFELKPEVRRAGMICNEQLDKMFRSKVFMWEGAQFLDYLNRFLPGSQVFEVVFSQPYDHYGMLEKTPACLSFNPEEEKRGREELRKMGVDPERPFVCFHARDSAWLRRARPRLVSIYGEWAPNDFRNADIRNYLPAAERLTELGYAAIRMGKYVENPIPSGNPRIIDYAWKHHSDFMDVYLSARCAFFIGQNSGMTVLPCIFRRPVAYVNISPLSELVACGSPDALFIPKKYYSTTKKRVLTFREILSHRLLARYTSKYDQDPFIRDELGLELEENTSEEIAGLSLELHQRMHSSFSSSPEDEKLQRRFQEFVRSFAWAMPPFEGFQRLRIGADFLRRYPELLDGCESLESTEDVRELARI